MQNIEALEKAAQNGDNSAKVDLGRLLLSGTGTGTRLGKDLDRAALLFRQASDDNLNAQVGLAQCHALGVSTADQGLKPMMVWQLAAEKNNAWGQMLLGIEAHKQGGDENLGVAVEWLEKAASNETGLKSVRIEAMEFLGRLYKDGTRLPVDMLRSSDYYQKAAAFGSPTAKSILALRLWQGDHLPRDCKRSLELAQEAAQDGSQLAAEMLARIYEWGDQVPANFIEARRYYALATKNGSHLATFLEETLKTLTAFEPPDCAKLRSRLLSLHLSSLRAKDRFEIAYSLDLAGDHEEAIRFYRRCLESNEPITHLTTSELKKIVYFREKGGKGYFDVLAVSTVLHRHCPGKLKIFIPMEQDEGGGYSNTHRQLIIESLKQWLQALPDTLQIEQTENKKDADLKFLAVDPAMFFGKANARTCSLTEPSAKVLPPTMESVVQLPKREIRSPDDRINFFSTCLHEVGHALGLSGHSIFSSDVLFPCQKHQTKLSQRDIAAIRELYAGKADKRILDQLRHEADKNCPYALSRFGNHLLANGREKEGVALLEKASKQEMEQATFALGMHHLRKLDLVKAREYFARAAQSDVPNAAIWRDLLSGKLNVLDKQNLETIRTAAQYGSTQALLTMGMIYIIGDGASIERDHQKAKDYLEMAASQGSSFAPVLLALNDAVAFAGNVFFKKD